MYSIMREGKFLTVSIIRVPTMKEAKAILARTATDPDFKARRYFIRKEVK